MAIYETRNPTKDGRKYYFRIKYKDIYGKPVDYSSQKFKLQREAKDAEKLFNLKLMNNRQTSISKTFKELYEEYKLQQCVNLKRQTIIKHDKHFEHLKPLESIKVADLDVPTYQKYKLELEKKRFTGQYNNKIHGLLKRLIKFSTKYYGIDNKTLEICGGFVNSNLNKEMNFYTYDEYKQFDSAIDDHLWHTFFELLYFNGLRKGEAMGLMWKDINFKNKQLTINRTLTTKLKGEKWSVSSPKTKNSIRTLPLSENLLNDLKTLYNKYGEYKEFNKDWFVFGGIRPLPETTIQVKKDYYRKKSDVKNIRIHDFRHSCASLLINNGANITIVSKYLGHGNISMTLNTYTHMYQSKMDEITDLINNLK